MFGIKARAVVFDEQNNQTVAFFQHNLDAFRLRVFVRVIECFLHDAVKIRFDFGRESGSF